MYGLVNAAIENLIRTNFGDAKWEEIKAHAGVELSSFNRMAQYPDDLTYKLVGSVSAVLGMHPDEVMRVFGEFWVLYTGREGYGQLFDLAGKSLHDFLNNLDELHSRVGQNFTHLRPPAFMCEEISPRVLRLHYHSERPGLCPMVIGLLGGLSKHFKTDLTVDHPVCSRQGAAHCEFVLALGDSRIEQ